MTDPWEAQREALGSFIHAQRKMANLSLRQLAELTSLSNPYLSQLERGLHQPSVRVLRSLAEALNLSAETLLAQAGLLEDDEGGGENDLLPPGPARTTAAILADPSLTSEQKEALLSVHRSFSTGTGRTQPT